MITKEQFCAALRLRDLQDTKDEMLGRFLSKSLQITSVKDVSIPRHATYALEALIATIFRTELTLIRDSLLLEEDDEDMQVELEGGITIFIRDYAQLYDFLVANMEDTE